MNKRLCACAWAWGDCDTHEERMDSALDKARQINEDFARLGCESLPDTRIFKIVRQVVADLENGKIERFEQRRATCTTDADEIRYLLAQPDGEAMLAMLLLFRSEHGARSRNGEPFAVATHAMAEHQVLGKWNASKYRRVRQALVDHGFIKMVVPATHKTPALYLLIARKPTPSLSSPSRAAAGQSSSIGVGFGPPHAGNRLH